MRAPFGIPERCRLPNFYLDIDMYMSPGSDLTLSIVCGWLARAISKQTESESNGYIMNVSM